MKRLVVTADDFGLTAGVNRGIVRAHASGIVTSTSVMMNAPAAGEASALARERVSLAVGLHFVLTFGKPLAPEADVRTLLAPDGRFLRLGSGAHESAPPSVIRAELSAQIQRFTENVGRLPTHIDGHHHVHRLPSVCDVVGEMARDLGVPVRAPDEDTAVRLRGRGVSSTGTFIDAFYGAGHVDVPSLVRILETLDDGISELMCHPAEVDSDLESLSSYARERAEELRTLTHPDVRSAVRQLGITLVPASGDLAPS